MFNKIARRAAGHHLHPAYDPDMVWDAAALNDDLLGRSCAIYQHLVAAYGGCYAPEDVGRAIAGQIANNGLTVHGTIEEVCAAVFEAFPHKDSDYDEAMPRIVGACSARLAYLGVDASIPRYLTTA